MEATANFAAQKYVDGRKSDIHDMLSVEEMLSITINHQPYTITMRTPGDEEAHTRGILWTEDVYAHADLHPNFSILEKNTKGYITKVNVDIDESLLGKGMRQQRNLLSVSSCGMCGKFETDLTLSGKLQQSEKLKPQLVALMFETMSKHQPNFLLTGGCHASALFTLDGELLTCKEDIGRHNAVDKAIGGLILLRQLDQAKVILVSGRVSYEIINKAFKAQIPFLCSVSAPSSMAVEYCQQLGITLLAFCRGEKFTVYTHAEQMHSWS